MFLSLPRLHKIGIFSLIIIVIFSFTAFYFSQTITEDNVKHDLLTELLNRQLANSKSISQHIGSDLTLIMTVLDGLTNSTNLQEGQLYGEATEQLMKEKYSIVSDIADKIFALDKNDIVTMEVSSSGSAQNLGEDFSHNEWIIDIRRDSKLVFSKGFQREGIYTVYIVDPIINKENSQYIGLIGASIPTEKFFARYGNVHDINSQFLVVLDKSGTILAVGPDRNLVGKNFFGREVQKFINHNDLLNNFTQTLLRGNTVHGIYGHGNTETINTGLPINIGGEPIYFLQLVTPTKVIFSKMQERLLTEILVNYSLLVAIFASFIFLVIFILRWNSTVEKAVVKRTDELNKSNISLQKMAKQLTKSNVSLQEANERLKKYQKFQQEFIEMAAHELRTPIQPILGLIDLLHNRISDPDEHEILDVVVINAKRLQRFSSDILDVTKIESGLLKLALLPVDLNEKIDRVISDIKNGADAVISGKKNKIVFEPTESITVLADRDRIYQVIFNLLTNALRHTENGTVTITAKVNDNADNRRREGIVTITDTGIGIDPVVMPKLFSKFTTESGAGTGLGLYISKGIIEAHGGRIWAENNPDGIGASFSFSLPVK